VGVPELLADIVESCPSPRIEENGGRPKVLLFDSWYTSHKGVVCVIKVLSGTLKKGQKLYSKAQNHTYEIHEIGVMRLDY
jgi:translation elongation factor EF-4